MSTRRRRVGLLASWQLGKRFLIAAMADRYFLGIFLISPQFKVRCHLAKLPEPTHRRREVLVIELARQRHRQAVLRLSEAIGRLRLVLHVTDRAEHADGRSRSVHGKKLEGL